MLERVYPFIGAIPINRLRPIALENLLAELRKRKLPWQAHRGGHGAEVPDRGLRRPYRRQAE